jgi:hypothetical protein
MVALDDIVELITPGVGDGDGVGVGVGDAVGVGVGDGDGDVDCACAAEEAPIASTSRMAIRRAKARPAPNLRIREARDEQRINFIPTKAPARKTRRKPLRQTRICAQFVRSVNRLRSPPRTE